MIIDSHMHIYRSAPEGLARKEDYEIWEYGRRTAPIQFSDAAGDVASAQDAMTKAGCDAAVVVNLHVGSFERPDDELSDLRDFNNWLLEVSHDDNRFKPLLAVDLNLMGVDNSIEYLKEMQAAGFLGLKLHPPVQQIDLSDSRYLPFFRECASQQIPIVSHCGPAREARFSGAPSAFRQLLTAVPDLKLTLAHLGGRAWREASGLASLFENLRFDLSEIVHWIGADEAPDRGQISELILSIGPHRVMMGSDFPWYDIDTTIRLVHSIPGLSPSDIDMIVGGTCKDFFGF